MEFLNYHNAQVESGKLEDFKNKNCCLILKNGFKYVGVMQIIWSDNFTFLDRKFGERKFSRDDIFVIYITPNTRKYQGDNKNE